MNAINALRFSDPKKWAAMIRKEMKGSGGRVPFAALGLGVHPRTLWRWLEDPLLADVPRVKVGLRNYQGGDK